LVIPIVLLVVATVQAQPKDPVKWSLAVDPVKAAPGSKVLARLTAIIEPGWHLYSPTTPPGPIKTTIALAENPVISSSILYQPDPPKKFDPNFGNEQQVFDGQVVFLLETTLAADAAPGEAELTARVRYQACSDRECLRPRSKTATAKLNIGAGARMVNVTIPAGYVQVREEPPPSSAVPAQPVNRRGEGQSFARFLLLAFGFGLAAVVTPCVFPMIPITMSFFLNRPSGSRADSVFQAALFCIGIVVLFSGLGALTTALLGPFGVVQLGSNPWVNGFIAAVFLAFGFSMLGAFEITLPSGILTRLDQASQRGGIFGTLLMGLTFALTSFACVGPFMGTLLAASVSTGGLQPLLGMASFAAGLSSPFFFLAVFPSYLKKLPKSGGWLPRVKVVLGFVVLAAMFYYVSNIDKVMQWGLITRERFLAAWVVLLAMPGLYLLGLIRMEGIKADEPMGVGRALVGSAFLIFSLSLVPGMFGARLGELDAYVPAAAEGPGGSAASTGPKWMKDAYQPALDKARQENKLVLVSFTGYACTNCKWMKANMFPRPEVAAAIADYVLVELYTDGTDQASEENQKLQETKFQTVSIPHYAILDAEQRVLASFVGLTKNEKEFLAFLKSPRQAVSPAAASQAARRSPVSPLPDSDY
jgi:thiol:disulfide interchange protein DsbD